jgi:hypothetical protein
MSFSFNFQLDGDAAGALEVCAASPALALSALTPPPPAAELNPARLLLLDLPDAALDASYASSVVRVAPTATSARVLEFLVMDPDRLSLPQGLAEAINGAQVRENPHDTREAYAAERAFVRALAAVFTNRNYSSGLNQNRFSHLLLEDWSV